MCVYVCDCLLIQLIVSFTILHELNFFLNSYNLKLKQKIFKNVIKF